MNTFGSRNQVGFDNDLKHNFRHVTLNVHEGIHSQPRGTLRDPDVSACMFLRRENAISFEPLAIRMTSIDNVIISKHVEFGRVGSGHLYALLLSSLYIVFGEFYTLLFFSEIRRLTVGLLASNPASKRRLPTVQMNLLRPR